MVTHSLEGADSRRVVQHEAQELPQKAEVGYDTGPVLPVPRKASLQDEQLTPTEIKRVIKMREPRLYNCLGARSLSFALGDTRIGTRSWFNTSSHIRLSRTIYRIHQDVVVAHYEFLNS